MATEFCQKCKQSHPGRACDYNDEGECAETRNGTDDEENTVRDRMPTESDPPSGPKQNRKLP